MLCTFQVKYNECFARIKLRDVWDSHFPRPYENGKVFYTNVDVERTPIPILDMFLTYPLLLLSKLDNNNNNVSQN